MAFPRPWLTLLALLTWVLSHGATVHGQVELTIHDDLVAVLDFAPDGKTLVTSGGELTAILWDTSSWQKRSVLKAGARNPNNGAWHRQFFVKFAVFSPDSKSLATVAHDTKIWDVGTGKMRATLSSSFAVI